MSRPVVLALVVGIGLAAPMPGMAADLYRPGNFPALASDRVAARPGDALTVIVMESASATNSAARATGKSTSLNGQISQLAAPVEGGRLDFEGQFQGSGQTSRSGRMVAQISVTVDAVKPNGDLVVSGRQAILINGERTTIMVRGRVRPADITSTNTVLSSRLADAAIDYNGTGFTGRSAQPGLINRLFNFLGLL
jgi:flagellar L-ring protein precursor FlgH